MPKSHATREELRFRIRSRLCVNCFEPMHTHTAVTRHDNPFQSLLVCPTSSFSHLVTDDYNQLCLPFDEEQLSLPFTD